MNIRTDLAVEMREMKGAGELSGVKTTEEKGEKTKTTIIEVLSEEGEKVLGKPIGKYITVELAPFSDDAEVTDERMTAVKNAVAQLLPKEGPILVAGIGNRDVTPDALGPRAATQIFATRHIGEQMQEQIGFDGRLRPVSSVAAGVLGQTGIETAELLSAMVYAVKPAAVITVDALASRRLSRLGCTIQLCDTGISPGSGVGNKRARIDKETLGVPVIAVGVPTVVDAFTLAKDVMGKGDDAENGSESEDTGAAAPGCENMMVTPREIDVVIDRAARLIALSLNCALQPQLSTEDLLGLM